VRNAKEVTLYSRRRNVLNDRFGYIATALEYLPSGTVIDGEVVGLGPNGHADFYLLQKFRSAQSNIVYYAFDILVHEHRDLTRLPLSERREILSTVIKPDKTCCALRRIESPGSRDAGVCKNAWTGGPGREAGRQYLSAWTKNRSLEQVPHQHGAGICHWRVYSQPSRSRFDRRGLLSWKGPHLCSSSGRRFCSQDAARSFREDQALENP